MLKTEVTQLLRYISAMLVLFTASASAGDPNNRFDGSFTTSAGWNLVGGYSQIANGVIYFEGRDAVNAYAYADLGDDAVVGDFELHFQTMITSANINPNVVIGGLGDTIGKYSSWTNGLFAVAQNHDRHGARFGLGYRLNGFGNHGEVRLIQEFQWSFNTWYYMTLARRDDVGVLEVYADSARTQLLGSESQSGISTAPLRYLYAFTGAWAGYGYEVIYGQNDNYVIATNPDIVCNLVTGLKAKCKYGHGRFKVRAKVITDLPEGTVLGLCLDNNECNFFNGNEDCNDVVINARGNASATWMTLDKGNHCVFVRECPDKRRGVTCVP